MVVAVNVEGNQKRGGGGKLRGGCNNEDFVQACRDGGVNGDSERVEMGCKATVMGKGSNLEVCHLRFLNVNGCDA